MKQYMVNEIYRSPQGEGIRQGLDSVFIRFTGCNMRCSMKPGPLSPGGFSCDTEFESGRKMTAMDILADALACYAPDESYSESFVVLTGGEPGLQVDDELIKSLHSVGLKIQIETNGSVKLPEGIDCVTVSPKVAEHCIEQLEATEVKYVRGYGQSLPKTRVTAEHYWISPAFNGLNVDQRTMDWCKQLVEGTKWKLSLQMHKILNVR